MVTECTEESFIIFFFEPDGTPFLTSPLLLCRPSYDTTTCRLCKSYSTLSDRDHSPIYPDPTPTSVHQNPNRTTSTPHAPHRDSTPAPIPLRYKPDPVPPEPYRCPVTSPLSFSDEPGSRPLYLRPPVHSTDPLPVSPFLSQS